MYINRGLPQIVLADAVDAPPYLGYPGLTAVHKESLSSFGAISSLFNIISPHRLFCRLFSPLAREKPRYQWLRQDRVLSKGSPHFGLRSGPLLHFNLANLLFSFLHALKQIMSAFLKKPLKLALVQLASGRMTAP